MIPKVKFQANVKSIDRVILETIIWIITVPVTRMTTKGQAINVAVITATATVIITTIAINTETMAVQTIS